MRTSSVLTISLPPSMVRDLERVTKKTQMTRSELLRAALRRFFEEENAMDAIRIANTERAQGKLKLLPKGGLAQLMHT
ncbi:ribbon-helix-helix protein, CopG family [Candidatus Uhrbacteria bacterium]|nr:ribbon-helix-helix protein, CopG family [Candidatus Uhrbacteria bacterium]